MAKTKPRKSWMAKNRLFFNLRTLGVSKIQYKIQKVIDIKRITYLREIKFNRYVRW